MPRLITGRDLEHVIPLFRRWGFVLVADIDDPEAFYIMTGEDIDVAGFLLKIIEKIKVMKSGA